MSALDPVKTIGAQIVEAIAAHEPELRRARRPQSAPWTCSKRSTIPQADRRLDDYPHQYSGGMRQARWRSRSRSPTTRAY